MTEESKPREKANFAQITSAWAAVASSIATIALLSLAVYAAFFSDTSTAFVSYLQSELALRNQRVATLESREQNLQTAISEREKQLQQLEQQSSQLQRQIGTLEDQRRQISAGLLSSRFNLVKQKVVTQLAGAIIGTWRMNIIRNETIVARTVRPWMDFVGFVKDKIEKMDEEDRAIANRVFELFEVRCKHLDKEIKIPRIDSVELNFDGYFSLPLEKQRKRDSDWERAFNARMARIMSFSELGLKAQNDLVKCLADLAPQ